MMLVERLREKFNTNEPIFTSEILHIFSEYSRAYVFRLIDMAERSGELVSFESGVYYIPTRTIMGTSTITAEDVVNKKYIAYGGDVYGIYSGLSLQNMFSLTTQMPNTIEIVSNRESMRCRKISVDGREVILRRSRCRIEPSNEKAYTLLQLFSEMDENTDIDGGARESIKRYMRENEIRASDLISLSKVFPARTAKKLMYSGVLNDFTQ